MTDKELADAVKRTAAELGAAIRKAKAAGLTVTIEVEEIDVTTYEDSLRSPEPVTITEVIAIVERRSVVSY